MTVEQPPQTAETGYQPANDQLAIAAVRAFRLRAREENAEPSLVVVHVQGSLGTRQFSVFGQAELRSRFDERHVGGAAWDLLETFLQRLTGQQSTLRTPADLDRLTAPILAELSDEVAAAANAEKAATRLPAWAIRAKARRAARIGVRSVWRRPENSHPERRPDRLLSVAAIHAALTGVLLGARGAAQGVTDRASWFTGDLAGFLDQHIDRVTRYACAPVPASPTVGGSTANAYPDVEFIGLLPKDGTKGHLLEREALRYGLNSTRFPSGTFLISDTEGRQLNFKWGRSPIASGVSLSICSYKEATRRLLSQVGVPVPRGRVFRAAEVGKALDYADRVGYPVVCKPVAGLRGIGVVTNIRSRRELVAALELYSKSQLGNDDFVIEQHVSGSDYRIVVIDGEVVAAVVREPASVVGDGIHTVADLIEYKNRIRALNPHLRSRRIQFSDAMRFQLAQAGLTLASVPEAGSQVIVANSANLSQGGDSFEVADELHPSIRDTAVRAVAAVPGLGFCGLDMLIEDHRKPIDEQAATVIELNAHAAIGSAQYPMWGTPTPVARLFFEACARANGIEIPDIQFDHLSVRAVIRGRVTDAQFRRWLKRRAERFGVTGSIEVTGRKEVVGHFSGPADAVSALVYLAILGPRNSGPTSVTTTHVAPFEADGFDLTRSRRTRVPAPLRRVLPLNSTT